MRYYILIIRKIISHVAFRQPGRPCNSHIIAWSAIKSANARLLTYHNWTVVLPIYYASRRSYNIIHFLYYISQTSERNDERNEDSRSKREKASGSIRDLRSIRISFLLQLPRAFYSRRNYYAIVASRRVAVDSIDAFTDLHTYFIASRTCRRRRGLQFSLARARLINIDCDGGGRGEEERERQKFLAFFRLKETFKDNLSLLLSKTRFRDDVTRRDATRAQDETWQKAN